MLLDRCSCTLLTINGNVPQRRFECKRKCYYAIGYVDILSSREGANCETMWCSMAAQENRVDSTVGAGFKPARTTAAPKISPNSPICVVLQLAPLTGSSME